MESYSPDAAKGRNPRNIKPRSLLDFFASSAAAARFSASARFAVVVPPMMTKSSVRR